MKIKMIPKKSELEEQLEYISFHCDPVELLQLEKGYGFHLFINKHEIIAQGSDIKSAVFDAVDQITNYLLD